MASAAPPRRVKRKRVRKARTAIASSSDSSEEDEPKTNAVVETPAAVPEEKPDASDTDSDLAEEAEWGALEGALSPPVLALPEEEEEEEGESKHTPVRVGSRVATLAPEAITDELKAKQHASFRTLWMQALTEEFGDELDNIRQTDPRLSNPATGASAATARLPLLIDALSFGSEVFARPEGADDAVDEMQMALPAET